MRAWLKHLSERIKARLTKKRPQLRIVVMAESSRVYIDVTYKG